MKDREVCDGDEQWLTPGQVAALFGVNPKSVTRWAQAGKIGYTRTVGGHRRYRGSDIYLLLDASQSVGQALAAADGRPPPPFVGNK
ncbi:BldC family transcriptional regulator [Rhodococcus erythropolis]|uniref:BldC family transcriptional regulator n=1 Tax=Rhodococcus erythropolis TaxID=1833 RepID=UPI001BE906DF|nr:BldC family transcriptional regulator [Rhodococcus erythropolis]MBT2263516.1 helix-turn-helix domain-containing protein [Rhodococcus erythropolis]